MKKIIVRENMSGTTRYYLSDSDNGKGTLTKMVVDFKPGMNLDRVKTINFNDEI